jgi:hypothetical protein
MISFRMRPHTVHGEAFCLSRNLIGPFLANGKSRACIFVGNGGLRPEKKICHRLSITSMGRSSRSVCDVTSVSQISLNVCGVKNGPANIKFLQVDDYEGC